MVLVDTNVLVYAHDPAEPVRRVTARAVLDRLELGAGALSAQALSEFLSVTTRPARGMPPRLTPAEALAQVERLVRSFRIIELTSTIVMEAGRGVRDHQLSYYDAQVWACARLHQISVVFSEDFQDGMSLDGVRFVNPFAQGFELAQWA